MGFKAVWESGYLALVALAIQASTAFPQSSVLQGDERKLEPNWIRPGGAGCTPFMSVRES